MPNCFSPGRSKIVVAVVFSLALHACLGVAWFTLQPAKTAQTIDSSTAVDGPDDTELVITLREPHKDIIAKITPVQPRQLPPAVEIPPVSLSPGPGEVIRAGNPPDAGPSTPEPASGKALHPKLKAGKSISYVIDRSSSMGSNGQLRSACEAVKDSLQQLNPETRFQIVAYNSAATMLANQPLLATPENVERANCWLDVLLAEGRSGHLAGLREALWQRPDAVFLLTDADDLEEKEVRAIQALVRDRVLLNVVLIGTPPKESETPLRKLCELTGGSIVGR